MRSKAKSTTIAAGTWLPYFGPCPKGSYLQRLRVWWSCSTPGSSAFVTLVVETVSGQPSGTLVFGQGNLVQEAVNFRMLSPFDWIDFPMSERLSERDKFIVPFFTVLGGAAFDIGCSIVLLDAPSQRSLGVRV